MATRGVAEGTGDEGLPRTGRTGQQERGVLLNPLAGGEAHHERAIEAPLGAEVQILDARRESEARDLEEPREASILAGGLLAVEEQREALLKGEAGDVGNAALFFQRVSHACEAEGVQQVECLLGEHHIAPGVRGRSTGRSSSSSSTGCRTTSGGSRESR